MKSSQIDIADLNEMLFENREKTYGSYILRKRNPISLAIATVLVVIIYMTGTFTNVYITTRRLGREASEALRVVSVKLNMNDLPPPPPVDAEAPPPPPPMVKLPPPQVRTVAFKVPKPTPEEELDEEELEQTIAEQEELKDAPNIGLEDKEGLEEGFFFDGEIEEAAPEPEVIVEQEPEINQFIFVEEEPSPLNMDDIRGKIGYPQIARDAGIDGRVIIRVLVDEHGRYVRHRVITSAHPILTRACEEHLAELRFTPAIQGGRPIKFWVNIPFVFTLVN